MGRPLTESIAKNKAMALASSVFFETEETSKAAATDWLAKQHKVSKSDAKRMVMKVS